MKNKNLFIVVIALVVSVAVIARTSPSWASAMWLPGMVEDVQPLTLDQLGDRTQQFDRIPITEDGIYFVGGICTFEVDYVNTGFSNEVDTEVPVEFSSTIPYNPPNDQSTLFLPGCHVVHYQNNQEVNSVSSADGKWTVCFGERPDVDLVIYYYLDSAESKVWIPLATNHHDGLACASAMYTGEYAPAHEPPTGGVPGGGVGGDQDTGFGVGSILPPSNSITISGSGGYSVGGICTLIVEYKRDNIQDKVHVQDPIDQDPGDWDANIPFPTENGLLYQPGCHVLHYQDGELVRWEQSTEEDGSWTICFAARPDKEMTIYYYLADLVDHASQWIALDTTVESGRACAPAQFTGMYTPGGKDK